MESYSDSRYEGRVDHGPSDNGEDFEEDWSDDESLAGLKGDDFEANLSVLRKEAEVLVYMSKLGTHGVSIYINNARRMDCAL